jgi:aspartate aminotransferase-like enzyme
MKTYAFPGIINQEILDIGAQQVPYMRTAEFGEINKDSEKLLLEMIHCTGGRTIIFTGSGTGAMSAVVENYVSTKKKAFVIDGGSFGHRWSQLCDYYGCDHVDMKLNFGSDIDYAKMESMIAESKPDVFLCQHHETSSGQLYDLKKISDICHAHNVSIVVDVISTFLAEELNMDELDLDICITSTQKGLNIPPGLSILFFNKKLLTENTHVADFDFYRQENTFIIGRDNWDDIKCFMDDVKPVTVPDEVKQRYDVKQWLQHFK